MAKNYDGLSRGRFVQTLETSGGGPIALAESLRGGGVANYTTTERDAIHGTILDSNMIIYNTTDDEYQRYVGGTRANTGIMSGGTWETFELGSRLNGLVEFDTINARNSRTSADNPWFKGDLAFVHGDGVLEEVTGADDTNNIQVIRLLNSTTQARVSNLNDTLLETYLFVGDRVATSSTGANEFVISSVAEPSNVVVVSGISSAANAVITFSTALDSEIAVDDVITVTGITEVTDYNTTYTITAIAADRLSATTSTDTSGFTGTPDYTGVAATTNTDFTDRIVTSTSIPNGLSSSAATDAFFDTEVRGQHRGTYTYIGADDNENATTNADWYQITSEHGHSPKEDFGSVALRNAHAATRWYTGDYVSVGEEVYIYTGPTSDKAIGSQTQRAYTSQIARGPTTTDEWTQIGFTGLKADSIVDRRPYQRKPGFFVLSQTVLGPYPSTVHGGVTFIDVNNRELGSGRAWDGADAIKLTPTDTGGEAFRAISAIGIGTVIGIESDDGLDLAYWELNRDPTHLVVPSDQYVLSGLLGGYRGAFRHDANYTVTIIPRQSPIFVDAIVGQGVRAKDRYIAGDGSSYAAPTVFTENTKGLVPATRIVPQVPPNSLTTTSGSSVYDRSSISNLSSAQIVNDSFRPYVGIQNNKFPVIIPSSLADGSKWSWSNAGDPYILIRSEGLNDANIGINYEIADDAVRVRTTGNVPRSGLNNWVYNGTRRFRATFDATASTATGQDGTGNIKVRRETTPANRVTFLNVSSTNVTNNIFVGAVVGNSSALGGSFTIDSVGTLDTTNHTITASLSNLTDSDLVVSGITAVANAVITLAAALSDDVEDGDTLTVTGVTGETDFNTDYVISTISADRLTITTTTDASGFTDTPDFTNAVASYSVVDEVPSAITTDTAGEDAYFSNASIPADSTLTISLPERQSDNTFSSTGLAITGVSGSTAAEVAASVAASSDWTSSTWSVSHTTGNAYVDITRKRAGAANSTVDGDSFTWSVSGPSVTISNDSDGYDCQAYGLIDNENWVVFLVGNVVESAYTRPTISNGSLVRSVGGQRQLEIHLEAILHQSGNPPAGAFGTHTVMEWWFGTRNDGGRFNSGGRDFVTNTNFTMTEGSVVANRDSSFLRADGVWTTVADAAIDDDTITPAKLKVASDDADFPDTGQRLVLSEGDDSFSVASVGTDFAINSDTLALTHNSITINGTTVALGGSFELTIPGATEDNLVSLSLSTNRVTLNSTGSQTITGTFTVASGYTLVGTGSNAGTGGTDTISISSSAGGTAPAITHSSLSAATFSFPLSATVKETIQTFTVTARVLLSAENESGAGGIFTYHNLTATVSVVPRWFAVQTTNSGVNSTGNMTDQGYFTGSGTVTFTATSNGGRDAYVALPTHSDGYTAKSGGLFLDLNAAAFGTNDDDYSLYRLPDADDGEAGTLTVTITEN